MPDKNFGMRLAPHERRQIERLAQARRTNMIASFMFVRHRLDALGEPFRAEPESVLAGLEDIVGAAEGPTSAPTKRT